MFFLGRAAKGLGFIAKNKRWVWASQGQQYLQTLVAPSDHNELFSSTQGHL